MEYYQTLRGVLKSEQKLSGVITRSTGGDSGTGSALPAVTPEDYGKQLFARGETWVVDEPVCGFTTQEFDSYDPEEDAHYEFIIKFCPNCGADMRGEQK